MIKNSLRAKIEDKEKKISIKSTDYDALIYHENIYLSPIYAWASLMHAFRDGMMGPCIRGGLLYFDVS